MGPAPRIVCLPRPERMKQRVMSRSSHAWIDDADSDEGKQEFARDRNWQFGFVEEHEQDDGGRVMQVETAGEEDSLEEGEIQESQGQTEDEDDDGASTSATAADMLHGGSAGPP